MHIRKLLEEREESSLSPYACHSRASRGRDIAESPCCVRTLFQHDRDRILHCKAFRRLKHKTQVFLSPEGDHYRTRLTHTLEVSQIARTLARALALNEDLTEAIALGHDLGHTPFGHAGERVLNSILSDGFHHAQQSLRVVERLEKDGIGLNLSHEVRQGILHHSKGRGPLFIPPSAESSLTAEAQLVRVADVMAYVNHDLDDALRAGIIETADVPSHLLQLLGVRHSERIDAMVMDLIENSLATNKGEIRLSAEVEAAILELREWLYERVYRSAAVQEDFVRASRILRELFVFFMENESDLKRFGGSRLPGDPLERSVADFIAGMTDRFALMLYDQLYMPKPWKAV